MPEIITLSKNSFYHFHKFSNLEKIVNRQFMLKTLNFLNFDKLPGIPFKSH